MGGYRAHGRRRRKNGPSQEPDLPEVWSPQPTERRVLAPLCSPGTRPTWRPRQALLSVLVLSPGLWGPVFSSRGIFSGKIPHPRKQNLGKCSPVPRSQSKVSDRTGVRACLLGSRVHSAEHQPGAHRRVPPTCRSNTTVFWATRSPNPPTFQHETVELGRSGWQPRGF